MAAAENEAHRKARAGEGRSCLLNPAHLGAESVGEVVFGEQHRVGGPLGARVVARDAPALEQRLAAHEMALVRTGSHGRGAK